MATKKKAKKTTKSKAKSKAKTTRASKKATSTKNEDRSGRRVPIQLLVDYKAEGHYLFDFCKDLGTGGVFIETKQPLPQGSSIDLTFTIPDSKETLTTKGQVIWVQNIVAERKDLVPGMGVQFKGFSGEQRDLLEEFLIRYHGEGMAPRTNEKQAG